MFGKLLIIAAIMMPVSLFAKEQEINKTIVCDKSTNMLPWFSEKFGEEPVWIGVAKEATETDETAFVSVVLNQETQTWSVVMYNREIACLLESGTGFKFKFPKTNSL